MVYIFVAHELAACRSKQSSALCIYGMLHHYHNRLYVMLHCVIAVNKICFLTYAQRSTQ